MCSTKRARNNNATNHVFSLLCENKHLAPGDDPFDQILLDCVHQW